MPHSDVGSQYPKPSYSTIIESHKKRTKDKLSWAVPSSALARPSEVYLGFAAKTGYLLIAS